MYIIYTKHNCNNTNKYTLNQKSIALDKIMVNCLIFNDVNTKSRLQHIIQCLTKQLSNLS